MVLNKFYIIPHESHPSFFFILFFYPSPFRFTSRLQTSQRMWAYDYHMNKQIWFLLLSFLAKILLFFFFFFLFFVCVWRKDDKQKYILIPLNLCFLSSPQVQNGQFTPLTMSVEPIHITYTLLLMKNSSNIKVKKQNNYPYMQTTAINKIV